MEISKKTLLLVTLLMGLTFIAISQPYQKGTLSVSMGGEVLFAERKLSATHHTGAGATVKGEYVFGKHASATLVSGYYFMQGKSKALINNENISAVPLKTGLRYYFGNFYAAGEGGAIFFAGFNQGTGFVYSFGMGDKITLGNRVIDIALRHESWVVNRNTNSVIAVRVGYEFAVNQKTQRTRGF